MKSVKPSRSSRPGFFSISHRFSRLILTLVLLSSSTVWAKKVEYRKTQDVDFDAVDVDGTVRNPDGAYLVQKRGIDFMPLYKVRKNFDDNIKESVEYVK